MATNFDLAELLFPEVTETLEDMVHTYPLRKNEPIVTRIAPSPTGFFHI